MDFDDFDYCEKNSPQLTLPNYHENFTKSGEDDFSILESTFSTKKKISMNFSQASLQTPDNLNNNLNKIAFASSKNSILSMQFPTCWDQFDNNINNDPTFGCYQSFGDLYETKPFGNNHVGHYNHGALIPYMDDINQMREVGARVLGHSQIISPINMVSQKNAQNHELFTCLELGATKCLLQDEGSSTTPKNDDVMTNKRLSMTTAMTKKGKGRHKRTNVVKGQWTIEEDRLLIQLVERYGVRKWSQVAQLLNGRIGKQCRERWHNHLRPDIKKDMWSEEEDKIVIKAHAEIGNKWAEIAKKLPGRTENSIKNHWNATKRRQFSRRKCRSKYPRQSSLLQDYIKNLSPETINAGCRKKPKPSSITTNNNNVDASNDPISTIEFDFSEVLDFNFDAQMFDDSIMNSTFNEYDIMIQSEVKKELDLMEMINRHSVLK